MNANELPFLIQDMPYTLPKFRRKILNNSAGYESLSYPYLYTVDTALKIYNITRYVRSAYRSDHSSIQISLNISKQPRGRGQWKFNNKLLELNDYLDLVKREIYLAKATYALPVYKPEYVENNDGAELELNISDALFLDTLLCQIRGETIKFSKKIARENRIYKDKLIEKSIDSNDDLTNKQVLSDYLDSKKEELETWRENKLGGAMIR